MARFGFGFRFGLRQLIASAPPVVPRVDWLDDAGAGPGMWYGANSYPAFIYDAPNNKVLGVVQRYNYNGGTPLKENTLLEYDITTMTATLRGVGMIDISSVVGTADNHGVGVLVFDQYRNLHMFGGAHGDPMKRSVLIGGVGSNWIAQASVGNGTYPHPVQIGNTMHLFFRENSSGTYPLVYYKSTNIASNGTINWASKVTLVDLQTDTRVYAGTTKPVGNDIYIPWSRANAADTIRIDVYVGVLDAVTGNFRNLAGTKVLTPAQQPLTRADADAFFRVIDQTTGGTDESCTPAIHIDGEGLHLLYQGGVGGLNHNHARFSLAGALLEGPTVIGTAPNRYSTPNIGPLPSGGVEVLFPKASAVINYDNNAAYTNGGDMYRTTRPTGGAWTAPTLIQLATPLHPLDSVAAVKDAPPELRFMFCERAIDDADFGTGGNCRAYGWGSGGLVTTPFVEDADAAAYIGSATYSTADRIVVTNVFRGMKASGWWSVKGDLTYLQAEPVEAVARKNVFGGYTLTDVGAGNVHVPYQGLKGSATSKFNTGWNPTAVTGKRMSLNGVMLGVASFENTSGNGSWDIGNEDTAGTLFLNLRNGSNVMQARLNDLTISTRPSITTSKYLALAQRINATTKRLMSKASASANTTPATVNATAIPNGNILLGGHTTGFNIRGQALAYVGGAMGDPGPVIQVWKRYLYERGVL